MAAIYYTWFGYEHDAASGWPASGGLGTFHWNDIVDGQLVTGFVANQPRIGYYASDSDTTIAWQLDQMKRAGIDTLIVSWWGWGDADLDGVYDGYIEERTHDALIRLLEYIKTNDADFKVAIMVEPWPDVVTGGGGPGTSKNLSASQEQMILDYLWDNVYSVYPGQMFNWQGKPLVAAAAELYFSPDEDDRYTTRSFRFKESDVDPGNAWDWIITRRLPYFQEADNTVILSPRYDEWFLDKAHPGWWEQGVWGRTEPLRKDPYLTEHLYDFEFRQVYEEREETDLVIIWAWNSWMEQLYIEPDTGAGAAAHGDLLLRKTGHYIRGLRAGTDFERYDRDEAGAKTSRPEQLSCEEIPRTSPVVPIWCESNSSLALPLPIAQFI